MQDESRKRRGPDPVSCAECRRLKLKCDRRLPCSSCVRRGCAAICPNGTLAAGTEHRTPTADTSYLQYKLEAMTKRIAELEEALAALHAQISDKPHPLLTTEQCVGLRVPPPSQEQPPAAESAAESTSDTVADGLGTLTLGEREHFFGQYAAADYLIQSDENASETPESCSALPLDILFLSGGFPMSNIREVREFMKTKLASCLPPAQEATKLIEIYYRHATWLFMPISKEELNQTIFARLYGAAVPSVANIANITMHELGMFFMILAIAYVVDPDRPPYNAEAANYYELGRAALAIESVIENPSIQCIRALLLMSMFLQMYEHQDSSTSAYALVGLNTQFAQSLGLHRDDTPWKLPESEQQRRRHLFWQVATYDHWSSFAFGRPPCLTLSHVDAKLAEDHEKFLGPDGKWQASFRHWLHTFTHRVLFKLMEQAFGVTPPTYAVVLRLDRLIREHPISDGLRIVDVEDPQVGIPASLVMQRHMIFTLTQRLLLFLHRSFFARALTECPEDPLKSKHAQSVLAAFRSAFYITTGARALHAQAPLALRFWVFWSPIFSACLVLGSIVITSPGSGLAPPAWCELNKAYEFLERLAPTSRRISRIMPKMRTLRSKAHEAYTAFTAASGGVPRPVASDFEEMEMRFLYGHSRLVDNASKSHSPSSMDSRTPPSARASQSPARLSTLPIAQDPASSSRTITAPLQAGTPSSDLFAELYSSLWPSADPLAPPGPSHQPQTGYAWSLDPFAPVPLPGASHQGLASGMPGSFQVGMPQVDWSQMDDLAQMPPLPSSSNLDIPWQLFMSGIGVEEPRQQQDGSSGYGLGDGSSGYGPSPV